MTIKEVIFNGEAGRLEGKYYQSDEPFAPAVVILHPHPLHGGTMNNKVVYNTFHTFVKNKFSVLRFNFRGIGKSQGEYDEGLGELMDAAVAMDWVQAQNPEASGFWLAGFSFGAYISLQLLMRRPEISAFIAISPPANLYDFNFLSPCPAQGLIIQGTKDTIVPEESAYGLFEKLEKQRNSEVEYSAINNGDHFFKGKLDEFNDTLDSYIKPRVSLKRAPRKVKRDRRRRQTPVD